MKIIILTQYYPPEIGAPQRRLSELAEKMVSAGHDVTVLTAMPNYPRGKIYDGYGGLVSRETINGVRVIRTAIYPTQKASFLHRLTNYFSFVISSAAIGTFLLRKADYLLVESPPLFLGLSGIWLSWVKRARFIFNVSDLWPESAVQLGLVRVNSRIHHLSLWLEKLCYKRAWLISGQSRGILSDIESRFPDRTTFRLSNGVDINKFGNRYYDATLRQKLGTDKQCIAIYAGLHGLAQGLDQLIQAADSLREESGLKIVLIGDGPEKQQLVQDARKRELTNIEFLDPVPAGEVPALLASSDIILITLKSYISGAVPSKLYEAMASGKPVIMVAEGEPADIVNDHETGIAVKPQNIDGIVAALQTLYRDANLRQRFGANGIHTAEEHFNREKIIANFIHYLESHNT